MFFKDITKNKKIINFLRDKNINSFLEILKFIPYKYEKLFSTNEINLIDKAKIVFRGKLLTLPRINFFNKKIVKFTFITKNGNKFKVEAYNRFYLLKILSLNNSYIITGTFDKLRNLINLTQIFNTNQVKNLIIPFYHLPKQISQLVYRKFISNIFSKIDTIDSVVHDFAIKKYKLLDSLNAFKLIHQPKKSFEIKNAFRTLKYEECLTFFLKMFLIKKKIKNKKLKNKKKISINKIKEFIKKINFKLTEDQKNAVKDILFDMNNQNLMYRLLQGDVGSGKTLVSIIALYINYLRGDQGVLMVPTDALARQHYDTVNMFFKDFKKINIVLLVGKISQKQKIKIEDDIFKKKIDIIIGTHALFSHSIRYSSLGLIIVDEQHRFGINQRLKLINKSENADVLLVSATPIPRTFALTFYGDLDISILKKGPFLRKIETLIVKKNDKIIDFLIKKFIENKKQIYIVTSSIDGKTDSVTKLFDIYSKKYINNVSYLHSKLDLNKKILTLERFRNNEYSIIISTSIIEVGLDIKNVNLMIIYDAINFGLANLHQLRGRIGRDGSKSFCLLVYDGSNLKQKDKLETLVKSNDGFYIANKDLEMRGPGEINGLKQSGLQDFNFVNFIQDFKIFECAKKDAQLIFQNKKKFLNIFKIIENVKLNNTKI